MIIDFDHDDDDEDDQGAPLPYLSGCGTASLVALLQEHLPPLLEPLLECRAPGRRLLHIVHVSKGDIHQLSTP